MRENQLSSVILVVDDNEFNLEIIKFMLEEELNNIKIILANNGYDALKQVKYKKPDLILLNFIMPGMDGFEVCKNLKKTTATKNIPIIFTSGCSRYELDFLEICNADFIQLPFLQTELLTYVKKNLY
jgi:two-component system alkaline phosphatase synthesis response regulator PhoP